MKFAEFKSWCLTFKLNGTLRWANFGLGFWDQNWTAAKCQVERMVRQHRLIIEGECMSAGGNDLCG